MTTTPTTPDATVLTVQPLGRHVANESNNKTTAISFVPICACELGEISQRRVVDRRKYSQLRPIVACLLHRASAYFVYNAMGVTHRLAQVRL